MSSQPSMSSCRVVSRDGAHVVVQDAMSSGSKAFSQYHEQKITFVDKTLVIETFLRGHGDHHLILRPRRCGKSFALSMIQEFLQRPLKRGSSPTDIHAGPFAKTAISHHKDLVSKHFQQYPVLYINLKDVHGVTYEDSLVRFDMMVRMILATQSHPYSDLTSDQFCADLRGPGALQAMRTYTLTIISEELARVYEKPVVVLIDEYDTPMRSALEHNYSTAASVFFTKVFSSLLKDNDAVYASMMVGVNRIIESGWLASSLNNVRVFPMHATDDRYARFFLFTETEVEILCESHNKLTIGELQLHYDGYTATSTSGPIKLYNPLSVVHALVCDKVSNYWVETGRYTSLSQSLWCTSREFHKDLGILLMRKSVNLVMNENLDYKSFDTISDSGLWSLLYFSGYLTIESVAERSRSEYIFRIPNCEINSEWHRWVRTHLITTPGPSTLSSTRLSHIHEIINNGDAEGFQTESTAFLQDYIVLYLVPHQKEKSYQALIFMLIFAIFGDKYNIRMEQDVGFERSDIIAHPVAPQRSLAFIIELKSVAPYWKSRKGNRSLKTPKRRENELEKAKTEALTELEVRQYRERVPRCAEKVHEIAFVFCGKSCAVAVRQFARSANGEWERVAEKSTNVAECMFDTGEEGEDEDEMDDENESAMSDVAAAGTVPSSSSSKRALTPSPREAPRTRHAGPRKHAGGQ